MFFLWWQHLEFTLNIFLLSFSISIFVRFWRVTGPQHHVNPSVQYSDSIFLHIAKYSPWYICLHFSSYKDITFWFLSISYTWLIYFITENLYLLISLTYLSILPKYLPLFVATNKWQALICFLCRWLCFHLGIFAQFFLF